jgi:hypothetical protein
MARREEYYTVDKECRDVGKTFCITEMTSFDAESLAIRAGLAILKGNPNLKDDFMEKVKKGTVTFEDISFYGVGLFSALDYYDIKPLLDDLLACVKIIVDKKSMIMRHLEDEDVEELSTIIELRKRALGLHINFSTTADTQTTAT